MLPVVPSSSAKSTAAPARYPDGRIRHQQHSSIAVSLYKRDAESGPASIGGAIVLCVLGAITMTHGLSKATVEFNEIADAIREKRTLCALLGGVRIRIGLGRSSHH